MKFPIEAYLRLKKKNHNIIRIDEHNRKWPNVGSKQDFGWWILKWERNFEQLPLNTEDHRQKQWGLVKSYPIDNEESFSSFNVHFANKMHNVVLPVF